MVYHRQRSRCPIRKSSGGEDEVSAADFTMTAIVAIMILAIGVIVIWGVL